MADEPANANMEMDSTALYREETITDRRIGSLQRLIPIKSDGTADESRNTVFVGQTQVMTPAGALPLTFEIPADSVEDAVQKFGEQAQEALADTMRRLEELRREASSSLIVPGAAGPAGGGGGIQIP